MFDIKTIILTFGCFWIDVVARAFIYLILVVISRLNIWIENEVSIPVSWFSFNLIIMAIIDSIRRVMIGCGVLIF